MKRWRSSILVVCFALLSFDVSARRLIPDNVVDGYEGCKWQDNGDGTSTLSLKIRWREVVNQGFYGFHSRGILIYTYDASGNLKPSTQVASDVYLDGVKNSSVLTVMDNRYVLYFSPNTFLWTNGFAFTSYVEAVVENRKAGSRVSIRAANVTGNPMQGMGDDYGEITGAAFLARGDNGTTCLVGDPTKPPPPRPSIVIDTAAPDWDLGELPRGDSEKTLAGAAQLLCFTYSGSESYRNFVVNATNANGMSGNRYLLRNASKPSQTIPYSLTLDSGNATFPLPNIGASSIWLVNANRTCFVPTFKTSVSNSTEIGDYSDVLSFTIVTKS
ncbi:hypothetical protein LGM42_10710 [Burkholderia sp. AU39826]|uniref:hypothetical protein n=1 Tax=Burkholderia TaxID=32008 RepID=UPI0012D9E3FD|nr:MULTISPECIES: hypothetical protein [Burkholderia]MCA7970350.1 hypothetical protein [Burkholderia sp. AU39826]